MKSDEFSIGRGIAIFGIWLSVGMTAMFSPEATAIVAFFALLATIFVIPSICRK